MPHKPTRYGHLVTTLAARLASSDAVPPEAKQAFADTATRVIHAQLVELFGGTLLQLYVPSGTRAKKAAGVLQAQRSEPDASVREVAARTGASERWVRELRSRQRRGSE